MSRSESLQALRSANPRAKAGFVRSVESAAAAVAAQILAEPDPGMVVAPRALGRPRSRRRLLRVSAAGVGLAAATAAAVLVTVGSPGGHGVADAAAAVKQAATLTAAAAVRSGTATVRITRDGELWAATTIQWNGGDLAVSGRFPERTPRAGADLLVVDGVMYGFDPADGGWLVLGDPASIDPDSGTTPDEYLAAVREDVGGVTLRRITDAMTGLSTRRLDDGSIAYAGTVAAGLIARETGFKDGEPIRVLPFGYVAHDEAADPGAPLTTELTVGPGDFVREIAVTWGGDASAWTYTVTYTDLGATPAPSAPENARPLRDRIAGEPPAPGR